MATPNDPMGTAAPTEGASVPRRSPKGKLVALVALAAVGAIAASAAVIGIKSTPGVASVDSTTVERAISGCMGGTSTEIESCMTERLAPYMSVTGVGPMNDILKSLTNTSVELAGQCHLIGHVAGRLAVGEIGTEKALFEGSPYCDFGYYHGVMQAAIADTDATSAVPLLESLCASSAAREVAGEYSKKQCYHGIGHALGLKFDGSFSKAAPYCDLIKSTSDDKTVCGNGIAMEWNTAVMDAKSGRRAMPEGTPKDPRDMCTKLGFYNVACLEYIAPLTSWIYNAGLLDALKMTAEWCKTNTTGELYIACMHSVGMTLGWGADKVDRQTILDVCLSHPKEPIGIAECIGQTIIAWVPKGYAWELIETRCKEMRPELDKYYPEYDWCAQIAAFHERIGSVAPDADAASAQTAQGNPDRTGP